MSDGAIIFALIAVIWGGLAVCVLCAVALSGRISRREDEAELRRILTGDR